MNKNIGLKFGFAFLVFSILFVSFIGGVDAAPKMKIISKLADEYNGVVVADGETEYAFEVWFDSRDFPDVEIASGEWEIWNVPDYMNFVRAELPDENNPSQNPEDFFYNFERDNSFCRLVHSEDPILSSVCQPNPLIGPSNRLGLLGTYYFTFDESAPESGNGILDLRAVYFYDTEGDDLYYKYGQINIEETFEITHEVVVPADFNSDGVLNNQDIVDFKAAYELGDLSADWNGDSVVTEMDKIAFLDEAFDNWVKGDFDGNAALNGLDIPNFKTALGDPSGFEEDTWYKVDKVGDFNGDESFNGLDIPGFKAALSGGVVATSAPLENETVENETSEVVENETVVEVVNESLVSDDEIVEDEILDEDEEKDDEEKDDGEKEKVRFDVVKSAKNFDEVSEEEKVPIVLERSRNLNDYRVDEEKSDGFVSRVVAFVKRIVFLR